MALIKCNECGKDVSDKAPMCPFCGHPQKPIVIEKTKKTWKIVKLISVIVFIVGLFMFSANIFKEDSNDAIVGLGIFMLSIGFIGILVGKFGAWWMNR